MIIGESVTRVEDGQNKLYIVTHLVGNAVVLAPVTDDGLFIAPVIEYSDTCDCLCVRHDSAKRCRCFCPEHPRS